MGTGAYHNYVKDFPDDADDSYLFGAGDSKFIVAVEDLGVQKTAVVAICARVLARYETTSGLVDVILWAGEEFVHAGLYFTDTYACYGGIRVASEFDPSKLDSLGVGIRQYSGNNRCTQAYVDVMECSVPQSGGQATKPRPGWLASNSEQHFGMKTGRIRKRDPVRRGR